MAPGQPYALPVFQRISERHPSSGSWLLGGGPREKQFHTYESNTFGKNFAQL